MCALTDQANLSARIAEIDLVTVVEAAGVIR